MLWRVLNGLLLVSIILGFGGCAASPSGTARFDENLVDPDRPPYPVTPPTDFAQRANYADLNKVVSLLKHQNQYVRAVLRDYPNDQKAQRVKTYTDEALPNYEGLMNQTLGQRIHDRTVAPGQ